MTNFFDEEKAYLLGDEYYISIQSCDDGWDYTIYNRDFSEYDGGQLDNPEMTIEEAVQTILEDFSLDKLDRKPVDYDDLQEEVYAYEEMELRRIMRRRNKAAQHSSLDNKITNAADHAQQQKNEIDKDKEAER